MSLFVVNSGPQLVRLVESAVQLGENNTVAFTTEDALKNSDHTLVVSAEPLNIGEIFAFEIAETKAINRKKYRRRVYRNQSISLGLILLDKKPSEGYMTIDEFQYRNINSNRSIWMTSLDAFMTQNYINVTRDHLNGVINIHQTQIIKDKCYICTPYCKVPRVALELNGSEGQVDIRNFDTVNAKNRIGLMYLPAEQKDKFNLHIIINGNDLGPMFRDIPLMGRKVHVVICLGLEVSRIRTLPLYGVRTLTSLCRDVIFEKLQKDKEKESIKKLQIPKCLQNYILHS